VRRGALGAGAARRFSRYDAVVILGAHESISGGLFRACERAVADGCQALQIFTKNSSQWGARPLPANEVADFRGAVARAGLGPLLAHDSYLINMAALDRTLRKRSLEAFYVEMARAEELGIDFLVTHPGAHVGHGDDEGLARVIEALDELLDRTRGYRLRVLLENSAGQGSTLGWRFEHLATVLDALEPRTAVDKRLGVCLDTCHLLAAGYPFVDEGEYARTWAEFDRTLGFDRLAAFHLNDSKRPRGSRVDRHAEIGDGHIGRDSFRRLVRDVRFARLPAILETPPGPDKKPSFARNLARLRGYVDDGPIVPAATAG
jgi:deoxyribonuclease-4